MDSQPRSTSSRSSILHPRFPYFHGMSVEMLNSATMPPSAPVAVIDILNGLLEGEQSSVFRFMNEGSPYLSRAAAELRKPLREAVETNAAHINEMGLLIQDLGGVPSPRAIRFEEQYLAFLNAKFLLPKLLEDKRLTVQRYENALKALGKADANVSAMLRAHLEEHLQQLQMLERLTIRS